MDHAARFTRPGLVFIPALTETLQSGGQRCLGPSLLIAANNLSAEAQRSAPRGFQLSRLAAIIFYGQASQFPRVFLDQYKMYLDKINKNH